MQNPSKQAVICQNYMPDGTICGSRYTITPANHMKGAGCSPQPPYQQAPLPVPSTQRVRPGPGRGPRQPADRFETPRSKRATGNAKSKSCSNYLGVHQPCGGTYVDRKLHEVNMGCKPLSYWKEQEQRTRTTNSQSPAQRTGQAQGPLQKQRPLSMSDRIAAFNPRQQSAPTAPAPAPVVRKQQQPRPPVQQPQVYLPLYGQPIPPQQQQQQNQRSNSRSPPRHAQGGRSSSIGGPPMPAPNAYGQLLPPMQPQQQQWPPYSWAPSSPANAYVYPQMQAQPPMAYPQGFGPAGPAATAPNAAYNYGQQQGGQQHNAYTNAYGAGPAQYQSAQPSGSYQTQTYNDPYATTGNQRSRQRRSQSPGDMPLYKGY